ncbi:hypothetical protein DY023_02845 [Microbacterium bovistercoris]|uniref:VCBS repeat-containing protein n=1 Tax=Microbacterium bovistercoris TaxID=2293570 RepID=A0A371NWP7_9MICO|nr:VCBS repeat-containing protein [Microbacterium bovistercoris]REJ07595.1 hypothetical protein DY023_02845 [Microbacterium bovistercoris]
MFRRSRRLQKSPRISRILTAVVAAAALSLSVLVPVTTASATPVNGPVKMSLVGFSAGNIISDAVFTAESTMTEAQIQSFFNSKVKTCQSGYTCLKDFRITSVSRSADTYCKGYTGAANESAARIIYRVSQSCDINPQVLIVMLQKEQGLVTHTWPSQWRYDKALGQACPDTAPCDPTFVGFFHQIYGAARQMQIYMEGRYFTWYAPGKTWNIRYNPNTACGSSPVYVANKATSALYYYTPYQPNAAALRAGYGTGDSCSAYGNRNFYNYFTDWFGSTQTPASTTPPVVPVPALSKADKAPFVLGNLADGTVRAYAFSKGAWGPVVVLSTVPGATEVHSVGDLTGDGHRDLIAVDSARRAWRLDGAGGITFGAKTALSADWSATVRRTPAGDFNGDGVPDMFTTDAAGALWLWPGDDRGSFRKAVRVGSGWATMNLVSGGQDVTGDGVPDLIARTAAGDLFVYPGDGRGGWTPKKQIGRGWDGMTAVFSPGDFGGDGLADVIARKADSSLWVYAGTASGPLQGGVRIGEGWGGMLTLSGAGPTADGPRVFAPGTGDLDGDRLPDITALRPTGELLAYRGDGSGGWGGSRTLATGWARGSNLIPMGDFTGDGRRDVGQVTPDGTFILHPGAVGGGLAPSVRIGVGWSGMTAVIGGIDFNGDRKPDVLARTSAGDLRLYAGNGSGGWAGVSVVGRGWGGFDTIFYAGDFDGDGAGDLITRRTDGSLRLYPTTGRGGWRTAVKIGQGWQGFTALSGVGDFDGDGKADVLARKSTGDLLLYRGNGAAGWLGSRQIGQGWNGFSTIR